MAKSKKEKRTINDIKKTKNITSSTQNPTKDRGIECVGKTSPPNITNILSNKN
jgi:hypothetical protein